MDILKDKTMSTQYNDANRSSLSRYANFPMYYNTVDEKYIMGLSSHLSKNNLYIIVDVDEETSLDYLANKYYGRPDYFWVIADFNSILDPFIKLSDYFETLKIPSLTTINYV